MDINTYTKQLLQLERKEFEWLPKFQVTYLMLLNSENQLFWHLVNMNFGLIGKDGNLSVSQSVGNANHNKS